MENNPFELVNKQNAIENAMGVPGSMNFVIYISHTQEICIACTYNSYFLSGLSFSTISDLERTQTIFNGMIKDNNNPKKLKSNVQTVLGKERASEIEKWYHLHINKMYTENYFINPEQHFSFVNGEYQGFPQSQAAQFIKGAYEYMLAKCEYRIANGQYIPVLNEYNEILSNLSENESKNKDEAYNASFNILPLAEIIRNERYLRISQNDRARELYLSLFECKSRYLLNRL